MALLARTPQDTRRISGTAVALLAGVAALAGTGGVTHIPTDIGYTLPGVRLQSAPRTSAASAQIRRVVTELRISHAAMARILGVSRQALYNWLNGAEPNPRHQATLAALDRVHATLSPLGTPIRALLTQPLRESQNFWQLVQAGEDPESLAQLIRAKYDNRANQRTLIAERLAAKREKGALADGMSDDLT
jgi:transcriptional regulator with XRE-family HTH domain